MEIWRPKLRWTEQHSSQIRTPRLILVQPGSGALQSAQTSVLCSFLDISKVAEMERWMSAMMWLFAFTPPSYRPTSAVNRCGP